MARHRRHADVAVDEALDVREELTAALAEWEQAMADGTMTTEEARRILNRIERARKEAQESVEASERANVAELAALSMLTVEPLNPHVRRQMADVGLSRAAESAA